MYWMLCAHPLFRMPVFIMGVLGGLQVLRARRSLEDFEDPNLNKNILHVIFPWGYRSKNDTTDTNGKNDTRLNMKHSVNVWSKRVDACSVLYILSLASLTVTQAVLVAKYTVIGNSFEISTIATCISDNICL